jgi:CRISPR-associated protein Csm1
MNNLNSNQFYLTALLHYASPNLKDWVCKHAFLDTNNAEWQELIKTAESILISNAAQISTKTPLQSAFVAIINRKTEQPLVQPHYYQPQALSLRESFFPQPNLPNTTATHLWEDLFTEVKSITIDPNNLFSFCETLLHLLHKYTITLPNPSEYLPDVSWYDYVKMMAAMAICLQQTGNRAAPFLLVKADMSGIQNYISEIVSASAAKNLKGRSFYVQLLSDAVLRFLLKELDLPQSNIVYNSGGNFLLLVPNDQLNKGNIPTLETKITENLFKSHKTSIAVIIDFVVVSCDDLQKGTHDITKTLAEKIEAKKKRKFSGFIASNSDFFDPKDVVEVDMVTGEDIEKADKEILKKFEDDPIFKGDSADFSIEKLNLLTIQQICLGSRLKKADYLVIGNQDFSGLTTKEQKYCIEPAGLGIHYYLIGHTDTEEDEVKDKDKIDLANLLAKTNDALQIYAINNLDFLEPYFLINQPANKVTHTFGFMFYGGNEAPTFEYYYKDEEEAGKVKSYKIGRIKTFSHLTLRLGVKQDNETKKHQTNNLAAIKRLGVLMLDVDGLGTIFKETNFASLASYSAFSRHLDYFFLGYLNTLWRQNDKFKRHSQIIYAGGDDLLLVGRWDVMVELAETIQAQLLQWSCQTAIEQAPKVSVSGGVAVVTHKFPVMKAKEMAESAEKDAKKYKITIDGVQLPKNAITLWGVSLNWSYEYATVKALKEQIMYYIEGYKTVFMTLQEYYYQHSFAEKEGWKKEVDDGKKPSIKDRYTWKYSYQTRWRVAYYIAKTQERYRNKDIAFGDFLCRIQQGIFTNAYDGRGLQGSHNYFTLLNLAIRWAELDYRTNYKKN